MNACVALFFVLVFCLYFVCLLLLITNVIVYLYFWPHGICGVLILLLSSFFGILDVVGHFFAVVIFGMLCLCGFIPTHTIG